MEKAEKYKIRPMKIHNNLVQWNLTSEILFSSMKVSLSNSYNVF